MKPKSASEAAGTDFVQSAGSPENRTAAERSYRVPRGIDLRCPQCSAPMERRMYGDVCLRDGCRTVLGFTGTGRPRQGSEPRTYRCAGCDETTTRRVHTGEGTMAVCERCEGKRNRWQWERLRDNPEVVEHLRVSAVAELEAL